MPSRLESTGVCGFAEFLLTCADLRRFYAHFSLTFNVQQLAEDMPRPFHRTSLPHHSCGLLHQRDPNVLSQQAHLRAVSTGLGVRRKRGGKFAEFVTKCGGKSVQLRSETHLPNQRALTSAKIPTASLHLSKLQLFATHLKVYKM